MEEPIRNFVQLVQEEHGFENSIVTGGKDIRKIADNYRRTEIPESVLSFDELALKVEEYLPNTKKVLKVLLAVAASGVNRNRVMLWMLLVGSPSSGKTDLLKLIKDCDSVVSLDNVTLNAFISGERPTKQQKVYDLLPQLDGKCLAIKDWTVIFSLDERACKKVIGDMVGAYDKSLSKHSSRRGQITYDSEFSHIGCITPATLNRHSIYLNMIGARFLSYTIPDLSEEEEEKSFDAIFSDKDRLKLEEEIRNLVSQFLSVLNVKDITSIKPLSEEVQDYLKIASRFMARARGIVIIQASSFKDREGINITYYEPLDMQIEKPWRAVQQLIILSKYLAFVEGRNEVNADDLEIIKEVVMSSMPADRAQALRVLKESPDTEITAKQLSEGVDKSQKTARRLLDEFVFLGLVDKNEGAGQLANTYRIKDKYKTFITVHPAEFLSSYNVDTDTQEGISPTASLPPLPTVNEADANPLQSSASSETTDDKTNKDSEEVTIDEVLKFNESK